MNRLDRFISYISPQAGFNRVRARAATALVDTAYNGASQSKRSIRKWGVTSSLNPDDDVLPELETLRDRSRDNYRNNPIGGGAIRTTVTNVVGTGLWLQSRIDREFLKKAVGLTDEQADSFEADIERLFRTWAGYTDADACRRLNFYQLQELAFLTALMSGESFTLTPLIPRPGTISDLRIQIFDADRVSNPNGRMDSGSLASGIELGRYGEPNAYYIETTPPGKLTRREWTRVTAFGQKSGRQNVIHLYLMDRPGQRRGVPFLAPVIEPLKQISRYSESELMAAVISSMFTAFIKSNSGDQDLLENAYSTDSGEATEPAEPGNDYQLGPGAIVGLQPDEDVTFANPGRPNAQFDPFVTACLRQIGMALEIPYEVLVKHFQSSYSASRGALMEAWKMFRKKRTWLADSWCQPIYEEFLTDMVMKGYIAAPGFFDSLMIRRAYFGSEWIGDAPIQLDPTKEVSAAEKRIALNLSSKTAEAMAMNGADWNTVVRQIAKEKELEDKLGVKQAPTMPQSSLSVDAEEKEEPEEGNQNAKLE